MEGNSSQPVTVAELIERIQRARETLEMALAPLTPEQLTAIGPEGWSIKDHLLHIVEWQRFLLDMLHRQAANEWLGVTAQAAREMNIDQINAILYERERMVPLTEALAAFRRVHAEVLQELAGLSQKDLERPFEIFDPDSGSNLLDGIINNSYGHDLEHLEWIRRDFLG